MLRYLILLICVLRVKGIDANASTATPQVWENAIEEEDVDESAATSQAWEKPVVDVEDYIDASNFSRSQNSSIKPRVVGGQPTTINKYPFLVSIQRVYVHICGGTIISDRWILTAAHCLFFYGSKILLPRDYVTVVAGITQINLPPEKYRRYVKKLIPHEKFDYETFSDDIGLLKIEKRFSRKTGVRKVALIEAIGSRGYRGVHDEDLCEVVGWGSTEPKPSRRYQVPLNMVEIRVLNSYMCKMFYSKVTELKGSYICAGIAKGNLDACQGDSGGPLLCRGKVQVGIVSWGVGCGMFRQPGIYQRIDSHRKWVDEHAHSVVKHVNLRVTVLSIVCTLLSWYHTTVVE